MYLLNRIYIVGFFVLIAQYCSAQKSWVKDSLAVLNNKVQAAKLSKDNKEVVRTYFSNALVTGLSGITNEEFQEVVKFIRQGIDFAESINEQDNSAIGYIRMANLYRRRNEFDTAISHAMYVINKGENVQSDSVMALAYIELGDCYQNQTKSVKASLCFTTALDLALKTENYRLESNICLRLSNLYYGAGDTIEAKRQLYKSVAINKKLKNGEGLIEDYRLLGRVTDNASYIDTVFLLADSLGFQNKILRAKNMLLAIYAFKYKDPVKALHYINTQKDVKDDLLRRGISNYNWYIGMIYRYGNMPDSALYYLKKAEPELIHDIGVSQGSYIYLDMAVCYQKINDKSNALFYYEKMLDHCKTTNDRVSIAVISDSLSKLYSLTGEYKKAFKYKLLGIETKDSLVIAAREKELMLLEMGRETKKHEEELRREEERIHKRHNLQYMAIIILLCVIFLGLTVLGMFPVSKLAIKMFGFISFICLFEFIILLIEHSVLHPLTHGDPLTTWLLKIVLIAILVRTQEFIEHRVIHYLQSRKLHEARTRFMSKKWWKRKKKPALQPEPVVDTPPDQTAG